MPRHEGLWSGRNTALEIHTLALGRGKLSAWDFGRSTSREKATVQTGLEAGWAPEPVQAMCMGLNTDRRWSIFRRIVVGSSGNVLWAWWLMFWLHKRRMFDQVERFLAFVRKRVPCEQAGVIWGSHCRNYDDVFTTLKMRGSMFLVHLGNEVRNETASDHRRQ